MLASHKHCQSNLLKGCQESQFMHQAMEIWSTVTPYFHDQAHCLLACCHDALASILHQWLSRLGAVGAFYYFSFVLIPPLCEDKLSSLFIWMEKPMNTSFFTTDKVIWSWEAFLYLNQIGSSFFTPNPVAFLVEAFSVGSHFELVAFLQQGRSTLDPDNEYTSS